jgi:hypothetical protein
MADFSMNDKDLQRHFQTFSKMFPQEAQKAVARMIGDQAYDFTQTAPEIISKKYTIRNMNFLKKKAFSLKRPKANVPIDQMQALAYSQRIDGSGMSLFTGFEEELTGDKRELRGKGEYGRPMTLGARGGNQSAQVKKPFRLSQENQITNSEDYGKPMNQFLMIQAKDPVKKKKPFILKGHGFKHGLYRFKPGKSKHESGAPDIEMLQKFETNTDRAEKFDWRSEAEATVLKKFSPDYIFEKYLAPALSKLWIKK